MREKVDFRLLYYFVVLAEELNYRKAAEKLHIAQPTLSQQIKVFENRLGIILFEKNGRHIELTKAGKMLKLEAKKILQTVDQTLTLLEPYKDKQDEEKITVACSGSHALSGVIALCHELIPMLRISVLENTTKESIEKIGNHQIDIAVVNLPIYEKNLEVIPLFTEDFYLVVSQENSYARKDILTLQEVKNEPFILLEKNYYIRNYLDEVFIANQVIVQPYYELQTHQACYNLAKKNVGMTILPTSFLMNQKDDSVKIYLLDTKIKQKIQLGLIYRKHEYMNSHVYQFIDVIKKYYTK